MSRTMVGSLFVVTLLFGVLLSSGVEARRLHQASLSIETNDGRQRGDVRVGEDDGFASATSVGNRRASSSARISSTPDGRTAQAGALGEDADGSIEAVGVRISNQEESQTEAPAAPSRPGPPRSTVSVSGSGSASVGGSGTTSVTIGGQTSTETTEVEAEVKAVAPVPAETTEEIEETPEPIQSIGSIGTTPEPEDVVVEAVEVPVAPVPVAEEAEEPSVTTVTTSDVVEQSTGDEDTTTASASMTTSVSISTISGKQEVAVDGKSGPRVCLTSDTSMLEELLDEGYDVTILTPTRVGYEVTMMARAGYATSETTFLFDHVPEDVQELCNYDPETAPLPARHIERQANPMEADRVLRDLCESRMVLYLPQLLDACWEAGYLTLFDIAVRG